jgi:hypothetical protein
MSGRMGALLAALGGLLAALPAAASDPFLRHTVTVRVGWCRRRVRPW